MVLTAVKSDIKKKIKSSVSLMLYNPQNTQPKVFSGTTFCQENSPDENDNIQVKWPNNK